MLGKGLPLAYEAWIDYDVCGARFSRVEMETLRTILRRTATDELVGTDIDISMSAMAKFVSEREAVEFFAHFDDGRDDRSIPNFDLDLSQAKPASYFVEEQAAAVALRVK